jgi:predicted phage terminase large subunit-like protein
MLWEDDDYGYGLVLRREKATQTSRNWSALYQQEPTRDEGDYFLKGWLKSYEREPPRERLHVYGASDYAVTADGGDYTVHVVVGLDPSGRMYLLDLWREKAASDRWIEAFCDLVRRWRPLAWAEEQGQIRAGIGPFLEHRMRARQAWVLREPFPVRHDKTIRAQSIRGRMALEGLYVHQAAPWFADLEHELLAFPDGKNDDMADALGLIGQLLDKMSYGIGEKKRTAHQLAGYRPMELNERDALDGFDKTM